MNLTNRNVPAKASPESEISPFYEFHFNGLSNTKHIFAVRNKSTEIRELIISGHTVIQNENTKHLAKDWQEELHISEKYSAYRAKFIDMVT